jgi:hypothetical protein
VRRNRGGGGKKGRAVGDTNFKFLLALLKAEFLCSLLLLEVVMKYGGRNERSNLLNAMFYGADFSMQNINLGKFFATGNIHFSEHHDRKRLR